MDSIKLGTLKSFDNVAYTASVQIAGSLANWLDLVQVSRAIAAVEMVNGRRVIVAFPTDSNNPSDGMVLGVHE